MAEIFGSMMTYVDTLSREYVSSKTALIASALQPAAITALSIYVLLWGFAHFRGITEDPIELFFKRIVKLIIVMSISINMLRYHDLIVDTFITSPDQLARAFAGSSSDKGTISSLDSILASTFEIGKRFWDNASLLKLNIGVYICALLTWGIGIAVCGYAAFLIILSKIFLSVIIALGPLFILSLFFTATTKFFESWIAQLSNYALIVVLVTGVNLFILDMFQSVATQAAEVGAKVVIADLILLSVTALVSLLVLGQVPQVAAGLAGGISMSTYGVGRSSSRLGLKATKGGFKQSKEAATKAVSAYKERRNKIKKAA